MALTTKQRAFVEHYLTHWNATRAAIEAGYSEHSARKQGSRMSTNVDIQAAIKTRLAELQMGADEVLTRLTDQARASLADFIDVSAPLADVEGAADMDDAKAAHSGWRLNLTKAEQLGKLHLVKKLKSGQWGPEIELHDAQAALALIGKHHRLFVDRTEHTGVDGAPIEVSDARDKLAALLARRAESADAQPGAGGDPGAEH